MGQADGKYWVANNPNGEITDAQAQLIAADAASAVLDFTVTWSSNEPTAADAQTVANGAVLGEQSSNPTEVGIAIASLTAKLNFILAALRSHGIIAS